MPLRAGEAVQDTVTDLLGRRKGSGSWFSWRGFPFHFFVSEGGSGEGEYESICVFLLEGGGQVCAGQKGTDME